MYFSRYFVYNAIAEAIGPELFNCMTLILGDRLYKSSVVAEMGDRGHNTVRKEGGVLCPFRGELIEVYFRTKWRLHPSSRLATKDMGQNWLGVGVLFS